MSVGYLSYRHVRLAYCLGLSDVLIQRCRGLKSRRGNKKLQFSNRWRHIFQEEIMHSPNFSFASKFFPKWRNLQPLQRQFFVYWKKNCRQAWLNNWWHNGYKTLGMRSINSSCVWLLWSGCYQFVTT